MTPVEPVDGAAHAGLPTTTTRPGLPAGRRPTARRRPETLAWPALLDALEERTRRLGEVVAEKAGEVPDTPLLPDGPLPADLQLRTRVLLAETERLARRAERSRASTARELHYKET